MADAPFITAADYPSVRRRIDFDLTDEDLPDAVIEDMIYLEAAVQDVLDIDPDAETRTGDDENRVIRAMILFLAARIAPAMNRVKMERYPDYTVQYADSDSRSQIKALRDEAQALLSLVTNVERPSMFSFRLAQGRRGR